jgi:hypothetical protein
LLIVGGQVIEMLAEPGPDEYFAAGYLHTVIALVDPETDTVIASVEHSRFSETLSPRINAFSGPTVKWIRGGEYAVGAILTYKENVFVAFGEDDQVIEKQIDYDIPVDNNWLYVLSPVSSTGSVAYSTDDAFVVENLITGERQSFDNKEPDEYRWLTWDPAGRYALLAGEHLWLLDLEDAKMNLLLESYGDVG